MNLFTTTKNQVVFLPLVVFNSGVFINKLDTALLALHYQITL